MRTVSTEVITTKTGVTYKKRIIREDNMIVEVSRIVITNDEYAKEAKRHEMIQSIIRKMDNLGGPL
jgi:hypothetical protein